MTKKKALYDCDYLLCKKKSSRTEHIVSDQLNKHTRFKLIYFGASRWPIAKRCEILFFFDSQSLLTIGQVILILSAILFCGLNGSFLSSLDLMLSLFCIRFAAH